MSLSLEDIKGELRENYLRTEEVLTGMDAYVAQLEKRVLKLEGQMAAFAAAVYADDDTEAVVYPPKIIISR